MELENMTTTESPAAALERIHGEVRQLNEESEMLASEQVKDLRREKRDLEAENARLQRELTRNERKNAKITLRMPESLLLKISAAARSKGYSSPALFLFELLARLQDRDLETAFDAFEDPAFGSDLSQLACNLGCKPGETLRLIRNALPHELCGLYCWTGKGGQGVTASSGQEPEKQEKA